jgi:TonB family protein
MRQFAILISILLFAIAVPAQSGRKLKVVKTPPPAAEQPTRGPSPAADEPPPVTAEKREYYRCSDDGSLARIMTDDDDQVLSPKDVDTRAAIITKPPPGYTREARRRSVQGIVVLSVVLSADGTIGRIGVVRALPAGLTENAMRAACKIKFKPAVKDGQAVSSRVLVEFAFRISNPSILFP